MSNIDDALRTARHFVRCNREKGPTFMRDYLGVGGRVVLGDPDYVYLPPGYKADLAPGHRVLVGRWPNREAAVIVNRGFMYCHVLLDGDSGLGRWLAVSPDKITHVEASVAKQLGIAFDPGGLLKLRNGQTVSAKLPPPSPVVSVTKVGGEPAPALAKQVHYFRVGDMVIVEDGRDGAKDAMSLKSDTPYTVTELIHDDLGPCVKLAGVPNHWFYEWRFRLVPKSLAYLLEIEKITKNTHTIEISPSAKSVTIRWRGPDGRQFVANGGDITSAAKTLFHQIQQVPTPEDPYATARKQALVSAHKEFK